MSSGTLRVTARLDHTGVPADAAVTRVSVAEGLSRLFDLRVEVRSEQDVADLDTWIFGTAALTLSPVAVDCAARSFHGVVEEARHVGAVGRWHTYALRIRPALHGLRYRVRSRIFQELNTVDIVKQVLKDAGVAPDAVRWDTALEYPVRTYCTQWKESELDFVLRLLEEEGIFYWFEHSEADHVLCLGDGPSIHQPIEGTANLPMGGQATEDHEALFDAVMRTRMSHDGVLTRDWSFESPAAPLEAQDGEGAAFLRYEYPGRYRDGANGARLAHVQLLEQWRDRQVLRASSSCLRFSEGRKFVLDAVEPASLRREYLLTELRHEVSFEGSAEGPPPEHGRYQNSLRALPSEVEFRPSRDTPRPIAWGLESAVVTGPSGEEIHVDEHGRIKVCFYWDRENPVDDTASCWVRFQQLNTQGAMILPRVGWEVHVAFENGDPDRPIALHKAYNQETMPPYPQPANKSQSALQSSTSPGGGSTNEIRMQDSGGGMEWFLHASKDLNVSVANDENETVGIDVSETISKTMSCSVGGDETGSVGADQNVSVTIDAALETIANETVTVGANDDWGVKSNFGFVTGVDRTESISGLMNVLANKSNETINGNLTRTVGAVQAIASATAISETVGGSKTETVSAAKAIITPASVAESIGGTKTLNSGAVTIKTDADVQLTAKGALAVTALGLISITCKEDATFTGSQVRITAAKAKMKGGGGTFDLGASITIDAKKFGGKGGPQLKLKGKLDYK